jgi:hypothetical protein
MCVLAFTQRIPRNFSQPLTAWIQDEYPSVRQHLMECVQLPGDVVFVPGAHCLVVVVVVRACLRVLACVRACVLLRVGVVCLRWSRSLVNSWQQG